MKVSTGQHYIEEMGTTYILAQTQAYRVALISLIEGNRWQDPVIVNDIGNIMPDEADEIFRGGVWKRVRG